MSFLSNIKISNVTNLSDARYAAAVGINYIGFCFDGDSPNYIAPIKAKEMIDWITGSHIVAEFGEQSLDEIKDISELLHVDAIELNNYILPIELPLLEKAVIKKIDISKNTLDQLNTELDAYKNYCDTFHLFSSQETLAFNENDLITICADYKIIWGLPITNNTVLAVLDKVKPFAINVSGGQEEKVGIKDFDELNDLLEVITVED
jgi:phosphoribosylanthranilate isomerase